MIQPPCVVPPPTLAASSHEIALDLSVKFMSLPVSPTMSTDFKNASSEAFDKLSDDNAAYYMSLQAIDCYLREGKVGQAVALQMAADVQARWLQKPHPIDPVATPDQRIRDHPQGDDVSNILNRLKQGYRKP